jgi:hypothetical protein
MVVSVKVVGVAPNGSYVSVGPNKAVFKSLHIVNYQT